MTRTARLILGLTALAAAAAGAAAYAVVDSIEPDRPTCVDAHGSSIEAAKIRLDGRVPCEGTR